jgi:NitT/TauT family transport system substrate-binding protein
MTHRLFAAAMLTAGTLLASHAQAADKTAISFANAAPPSLALGPYAVADLMGYFAEEGLEPTLKVFAGGANTVAQTVNKATDISLPGNEPVIIGKQAGRDPLPVKFYYNANPTNIWEMVVLADSPIKSLQDLKGRNIGIFAPSASNVPQIKAVMRRLGIDPDKDVQMRSIGLGAGALNALKTGVVDVVALYDTEHAAFETTGTAIRRLPRDETSDKLFSNGLLAHEDWFKDANRRAVLVKFARAYAKGSLFCEVNPKACVELTWRKFPPTKPTGIEEGKALQDAIFVLKSKLVTQKLREYQNDQYGLYEPARWQTYVDFMLAEKVIEKPVDIETLFTNDLVAEINKFDRAAVVKQAEGK